MKWKLDLPSRNEALIIALIMFGWAIRCFLVERIGFGISSLALSIPMFRAGFKGRYSEFTTWRKNRNQKEKTSSRCDVIAAEDPE